ncbi:MAG: glycoside hydrolase family protein [Acidobacteriaceae bacterium]|nr:glycoside hydrolase family protein [Acidobacteriaceae bacterium]
MITHLEDGFRPKATSRTRHLKARPIFFFLLPLLNLLLPDSAYCQADQGGIGPKPFIDYFLPIPVCGKLCTDVWGAATVGPRNPNNGLEDITMKHWDYWDGKIIRGPDGKYWMFGSRWDQAIGHSGWIHSKAIEAVSTSALGPYQDDGLCWPDNEGGKGPNVTALQLLDGTYAVVVSETRNGDVFTSRSIEGPWTYLGAITANQDNFHSLGDPGDRRPLHGPNPRPWHGSNVTLILRPDGRYEIVQRSGQILISRDNVLGPYEVEGDSIYRSLPGLPQDHLERLEDPVIWFSGGWYHIVVNNWGDRRAYHLISRNGITGWKFQGLAYEPDADFIRYANGTVNHWNKLERPGVLIENGHLTAISLAVIDVPKEDEKGNDGHGSKVIVIPFDGAGMDRDLAHADQPR